MGYLNATKYYELGSLSGPISTQTIDCGGKVGRYVRIRFPGGSGTRVFPRTAVIAAYREKLKMPPLRDTAPGETAPRRMVCYAMDAREATETDPSAVISWDPDDAVFYSTCMTYKKKVRSLDYDRFYLTKACHASSDLR